MTTSSVSRYVKLVKWSKLNLQCNKKQAWFSFRTKSGKRDAGTCRNKPIEQQIIVLKTNDITIPDRLDFECIQKSMSKEQKNIYLSVIEKFVKDYNEVRGASDDDNNGNHCGYICGYNAGYIDGCKNATYYRPNNGYGNYRVSRRSGTGNYGGGISDLVQYNNPYRNCNIGILDAKGYGFVNETPFDIYSSDICDPSGIIDRYKKINKYQSNNNKLPSINNQQQMPSFPPSPLLSISTATITSPIYDSEQRFNSAYQI